MYIYIINVRVHYYKQEKLDSFLPSLDVSNTPKATNGGHHQSPRD